MDRMSRPFRTDLIGLTLWFSGEILIKHRPITVEMAKIEGSEECLAMHYTPDLISSG